MLPTDVFGSHGGFRKHPLFRGIRGRYKAKTAKNIVISRYLRVKTISKDVFGQWKLREMHFMRKLPKEGVVDGFLLYYAF